MGDNKRMANDAELKQLIDLIGGVAMLANDVVSKSYFSAFGDLLRVGNEASAVLKDGSVLVPEWTQLDDAARTDLEAYIAANVQFPASVTVQMVGDAILTAAVELSKVFQMLKPVKP